MRFRKKPVVIDAVHWVGTPESATEVIDWVSAGGGTARYHGQADGPGARTEIAIDTLEGTMLASPGDWVIRGVKGEHYPCKPDIFEATYDAVFDSADPIQAAITEAAANPGPTVYVKGELR